MYGLVLEGGGAKGSYHIGVYKAILEEEINIKAVVGTSIGALNGALIAQGDYGLGVKLWNEVSYADIIESNEMEIKKLLNSKLNFEDLKLISKNIISIVSDRGLDITPFKELLNEHIDEEKIRSSSIDFGMVTINLSDMRPIKVFIEDIPEGRLADFLLASSYLPIFKFERLGGKIYLDGGFYDNLPFKLLQDRGYKNLILVRTHARGFIRKTNNIDGNVVTISPSRDIGRSFIYEKEKARENIEMGYYDALKVFRGLKGSLYYIEPKDENYYLQHLLKLDSSKIKEILNKLHITSEPNKRVLFEYIIPKLALFIGLKEDYSYEDLLIELLERIALKFKIKSFEIYSFEELLNVVKEVEKPKEAIEELDYLGKTLKKVDLINYFNRDEIIISIAKIVLMDKN